MNHGLRSSAGLLAIVAVAAGAVATGVAISGCSLEDHYKFSDVAMENKTFPAAGIDKVEMRLGSADITIVTKEGPQAEFIIKKTYRATEKAYGEKLLRESEVTIERRGSTLAVGRKEPTRITGDVLLKGYVSIDITATLPAGLALDILTGSGDLQIDDRAAAIVINSGSGDATVGNAGGGFDMRSGSGDVRVHSAKGPVKCSTGSGDVFLGKLEGTASVSTGSGEINIESIGGNCDLSTGSGDISVAASSGEALAKTGSGEVEFKGHRGNSNIMTSSGGISYGIAGAEGTVDLRTSSGDVSVTLYGTDSVAMEVVTMTGSITTKVPIVVKEASRRRLVGVAGDGKVKLGIQTSSGDVSITRGTI